MCDITMNQSWGGKDKTPVIHPPAILNTVLDPRCRENLKATMVVA